jgi:hypothetical protein
LSIFAATGRDVVAIGSRFEGTSKMSFFAVEGEIVGEVTLDSGMSKLLDTSPDIFKY